ncbi:MAG: ATP-binding domain-containing protein [Acidothermus sp.]|nr:ATP-binding domain-containing protein [Acidothermus sp.]
MAGGIDVDRAAVELAALLDRASRDGHTLMPAAVARAALAGRGLDLDAALDVLGGESGEGTVARYGDGIGWRRLLAAEELIATVVAGLVSRGRLFVVTGPQGAVRDAVVRERSGPRTVVVDDAQLLDVEAYAALFSSLEEGEDVLLVGDLDMLPSPGPGQVLADLVAAPGVSWCDLVTTGPPISGEQAKPATEEIPASLGELAAAIRRGELPPVDDPARHVVVVPVANADEGAHRVGQLVGTSIPRAFGIAPAEIQVLTPLRGGPGGVDALCAVTEPCGAPPPLTVHAAAGRRWPAVVAVFPPDCAGVLSRALVYTAVTRATRHLSIVHGVGSALAYAVARVPNRPRRTTLGDRLRVLLGGTVERMESADGTQALA